MSSSTAGSYVPPVVDGDTTQEPLPTIGQQDMTPEEIAMENEEIQRKSNRRTLYAVVAAGVAMIAALGAVVIEGVIQGGIFIYLAMAFPLTTAPYTVHAQRKLNLLPTLRQEHNAIRGEVNRLQVINNGLVANVDRLEGQVQRMKGVEAELEAICAEQGQNVSELQGLVKENARVIHNIKKVQETEIMQTVLSAFISADRSGDGKIDDREMNMLVLRLKALPSVSDNVDEAKLRRSLQQSPNTNLVALFQITADLMNEEKLEMSKPNKD